MGLRADPCAQQDVGTCNVALSAELTKDGREQDRRDRRYRPASMLSPSSFSGLSNRIDAICQRRKTGVDRRLQDNEPILKDFDVERVPIGPWIRMPASILRLAGRNVQSV